MKANPSSWVADLQLNKSCCPMEGENQTDCSPERATCPQRTLKHHDQPCAAASGLVLWGSAQIFYRASLPCSALRSGKP